MPVPAGENTLEIHIRDADPSVLSTLIVSGLWHAQETSVLILVQEHVDITPNVESSTITLHVHVCQIMLGIHSEVAALNVSTACFSTQEFELLSI